MEVFLVLLTAAVIFVVFVTQSADEKDIRLGIAGREAEITLEEATQINRIGMLRLSAPELSLQLAAQLWGHAWQIAHIPLCSTLLQLGRKEQAIQLLSRLDASARQDALTLMLSELVDAGRTTEALALQTQLGAELPHAPLLRCTLLIAAGDTDQASQALSALAQNGPLTDIHLLQLARLQHDCGMPQAAQETLATVRSMLSAEEGVPFFEWRPLLETLADIQHYPTLLKLAERSEEHKRCIIELLSDKGQHAEALHMLTTLESPDTPLLDHEKILGRLLDGHHHDLARQLLAGMKYSAHSSLLLHYLDWYAGQGDTRQAQQLLDSEAPRMEPHVLNWLLLTLAERLLDTQPRWAADLQRQSERLVNSHKEQPEWLLMQLLGLQHRLTAQSKRAANQRDSWTVRTLLEEKTSLLAQLDAEDALGERISHSALLHALDEPKQARQLLTDTQRQLATDRTLDDDERHDYYDDIAAVLITFGDLDQARSLLEKQQASDRTKTLLLDAYIDVGRLEEALELIDFRALINVTGDSALNALHLRIRALKEQDQQRYQRLEQRLLDVMDDDRTWNDWGQVVVEKPLTAATLA